MVFSFWLEEVLVSDCLGRIAKVRVAMFSSKPTNHDFHDIAVFKYVSLGNRSYKSSLPSNAAIVSCLRQDLVALPPICFRSVITACEEGSNWQMALALLQLHKEHKGITIGIS